MHTDGTKRTTQHSTDGAFGQDPRPAAPHNLEVEKAALGAILYKNAALDSVIDILQAEHFYDQLHGQIYTTLRTVIGQGKEAKPVTLAHFFEAAEPIDAKTTVPQYLMRLSIQATTVINVRDYARVIIDLAKQRSIILIAEDMLKAAYESPVDFPPKEQIEDAETRLFALLVSEQSGRTDVRFSEATQSALLAVKNAVDEKPGVQTGLIDLDDMLGGLQPGELILLAARPSMGKTALATNIAVHAGKDDLPVAFFSQEMSAQQIALRVLGEHANISLSRARRGLEGEDWLNFAEAAKAVGRLPIIIDEMGGQSITQLVSRARRMKAKFNAGLIVIDYLQLMHAGKGRAENRNLEITAITGGLKELAKELNVPVLLLSQLNREVEKRADKRPQLSDLRDSGAIEQDADVVMFVYREEYYWTRENPEPPIPGPFSSFEEKEEYANWGAEKAKIKGLAELIIGKQRNGATGIVNLAFNQELMRFSNLRRGS